jgi:hypothetical protein
MSVVILEAAFKFHRNCPVAILQLPPFDLLGVSDLTSGSACFLALLKKWNNNPFFVVQSV